MISEYWNATLQDYCLKAFVAGMGALCAVLMLRLWPQDPIPNTDSKEEEKKKEDQQQRPHAWELVDSTSPHGTRRTPFRLALEDLMEDTTEDV
ncbi:Hypothetical predicted protein [Lecanosticta acicola]|uniref:Uncharacterized protein n=1 Tax=Lecanosticta acicola TaxID=111012 RepID=A0AAI9EEQ0_9PEZI|nr:Hypothetical predicted protein [Lecanosticta acicola]